jgi:glutamate--cysteine ligase
MLLQKKNVEQLFSTLSEISKDVNLSSLHSETLNKRLALFDTESNRFLLSKGLRGIERETLRVNHVGKLAITPHPSSLGSALTHPYITTDYSESLLEFITPAVPSIEIALKKLDEIHHFTHTKLNEEILWHQSMPCNLPADNEIPIAWYGNSHIGMLKHVYRKGLALRYGRSMQCIAGIHYNFSVDESLWETIRLAQGDERTLKDFQSESYVALIRNFHRYSWLLMYLFGASPALSKNFLHGKKHQLEALSEDTLYLPYATSLRMSDLGYQNNAQDGLVPPYNTLLEYMRSLSRAVRKPYPAYDALGTQENGEWTQINTNVLQIENEFYATIRPKRVIEMGERPIEALCSRGVQYIEVRCMDIDPFDPLGISLETGKFLDAFLLFCALDESPLTNDVEGKENLENFGLVVKTGRQPGLKLHQNGKEISLQDWGLSLLEKIASVSDLLDRNEGDSNHQNSLKIQEMKLRNVELTPSSHAMKAIRQDNSSFNQFSLTQSEFFAQQFKNRSIGDDVRNKFEELTKISIEQQAKMENDQCESFDDFIKDYRSRTSSEICDGNLK